MQIAPGEGVVIRESMKHPKALIQMVAVRDQAEKYLLLTRYIVPATRHARHP